MIVTVIVLVLLMIGTWLVAVNEGRDQGYEQAIDALTHASDVEYAWWLQKIEKLRAEHAECREQAA